MFAPGYHSAMKYVGPVRKKIGKRTIFNLIGPLSSPAKVKRQVVGVFDKKLLKIFAEALKNLNLKSKDFVFCVELPIKANRNNLKLVTSKSNERERIGAIKKPNAFKDGFKILFGMIKLFFKLS